jgi:hypothetical protein
MYNLVLLEIYLRNASAIGGGFVVPSRSAPID